jgi:hypothetical protein
MKQTCILFSLTFGILLSSFTLSGDSGTVYICASKSSKAYHLKRDCFALKNCTHEIRGVSQCEAENAHGRTLCGHEK